MIYLICLIFYIGILIFLNLRKDLNSFEKFGWGSIIFIITFIVSAMINLIIISLIPPDINETGVPVIINPVTNEYHIINSSGKIIEQDNINFIVSCAVHLSAVFGNNKFNVVFSFFTTLALGKSFPIAERRVWGQSCSLGAFHLCWAEILTKYQSRGCRTPK